MYYTDSYESRPLQVSAFVGDLPGFEGKNALVRPFQLIHETSIAGDVDGVGGIREYYAAQSKRFAIDGAVSIVYNGTELLGPRYWIEFVTMTSLYEVACENGLSRQDLFTGSRARCDFDVTEAGVRYSLREQSNTVAEVDLPFRELIVEWALMYIRLERVRQALGDIDSRLRLASPFANMCHRYVEIVGEQAINYTTSAPLEEVFGNPRMM